MLLLFVFPYEIPSQEIQTIIDEMYKVEFHQYLSARQIGIDKDIFISKDKVWINPEILSKEPSIVIRAYDRNGHIFTEEISHTEAEFFIKIH